MVVNNMSYYRKIDSITYDNGLLTKAESITQMGDVMTEKDMWGLIEHCKDGGKFTATELRTLDYIAGNFKFSDTGEKQLSLILWMCRRATSTLCRRVPSGSTRLRRRL